MKELDNYSLFDFFGSGSDSGFKLPSIGGIQADIVNLKNLTSGKAKSQDWGGGVGGVIGSLYGSPQSGSAAGRTVFPILNNTVKPFLSNLWNEIKK